MLGITDERWVAILTTGSVLFAAGFGLLALFTDYKQNGKVTRWGRTAACGVVLTALLSIWLGVLKDHIASQSASVGRKIARMERKDERQRLNAQLAQLTALSSGMDTSLGKQDSQLLQQKEQNAVQQGLMVRTSALLRSTTVLGIQQRASTAQMLRQMWEDGYHVTGQAIQAAVAVKCSQEPAQYANIIEAGWPAMLSLRPAGSKDSSDDVTLYSFAHRSVRGADGGDDVDEVYIFTDFMGDLKGFSRFENWRGASVSLLIRGSRTQAAPLAPVGAPVQFGSATDGLVGPSGEARRLPCTYIVTLLVHGRGVLANEDDAAAYLPNDGVDGAGAKVFILSPFKPVDDEALPRPGP